MNKEKTTFQAEREISTNGQQWIGRQYEGVISPFGCRLANMLDEVFSGIYHLNNVINAEWSHTHYIAIRLTGGVSTYDFNVLTRLVFACHDHAIRMELSACNMQYIKLAFCPRTRTGDDAFDRHPTIEEALSHYRQQYPLKVLEAA